MPELKIRIQSLEDAARGVPAIETNGAPVKMSDNITIAFLEKGTVAGNTSVMIALKNSDGSYSVAELTKGLFDSAHQCMTGAVALFGK